MTKELNTLLTALYVLVDDHVVRPRTGRGRHPWLSDSELVTLAVAQVLLGYHSERRWVRHIRSSADWHAMFPYLPKQPGYHKRLKDAGPLLCKAILTIATCCPSWFDDLWMTDATPVPCGMSRETVKRSDLVGYAGYGYCASHSRYYWGLKLYLVCAGDGMPMRLRLLRPDRKDETYTNGNLGGVRQWIESVNQSLKGQLDLEAHGGCNPNRGLHPRRPASAGPGRRHLAQLEHRRHQQTITDRLRSLTIFKGINHLVVDAFDADVLIYAAAPDHPLGRRVAALFPAEPVRASDLPVGVGSLLLLSEVLGKPLRDGLAGEVQILTGLLGRLDLRPVDRATAELAVALSAAYGLRAADATHLATAVALGADRFITNNPRDFPTSIAEVEVTYPADLPLPG